MLERLQFLAEAIYLNYEKLEKILNKYHKINPIELIKISIFKE